MSRVALRRHLSVLALAGILPLAILAAAALLFLYEEQRELAEHRALDMTRAVAVAVDAELARSLSALQILASSLSLDHGELSRFDEMMHRALKAEPKWRRLILADDAANVVLDSDAVSGARLREPETYWQVVRSGRPIVGNLVRGPDRYAFAVRVPIVQGGAVKYVLSAVIDPETIHQLIRQPGIPRDSFVAVFDARGARVSRSPRNDRYIGTPASDSLREMMRRGSDEGTGITTTSEGDDVFTAYKRLASSGWSVAMGLPVAAVTGMAARSSAMFGAAVGLSLAIALAAAFVFSRRVNRPIAQLRAAADALGQGAEPAVPDTDIVEIHDVGAAMLEASRERRLSEAEREELLRRAHEARAEAEAASRAKDQLIAMLGHELRNPLAAISGAAALLGAERAETTMGARARDVIQRQVTHLARLTDDLLDTARALVGKIELRREKIDLGAIVSQALATLNASGRLSGHRVVTDLEPAWIDGDEVRLEQIVSNLVVNAVKYTPSGGTITVRTRAEGGESVLSVRDDGIGLSPALAARAFDLFVQGERGLDRMQGGLGIGLTLVKQLAQLHGGSVELRSEGENRGSEFTLRLPAIAAPVARAPAAAPAQEPVPHSILVVEDNDDARETLEVMLRMMGHRVQTAADGPSGLEKALATLPDVALVDLGLPGIDGFELARRVRAATGRRIRLFAVTGYGTAQDQRRAFEAGFDAHLTKPLQTAQLVELLAGSPAPALEE